MPALASLIGQDFAFAHGRIGILQLLLLEQSDIDRLLGAHSEEECEKILTEVHLTDPIDQGLSSGDEILNGLETWVRSEVKQMSPVAKRPIFHILWLQGDAPLLAYRIKEHHGLTSEISTEPTGELSDDLIAFLQGAKALKDPTPQEIDTAVAQYVVNAQLRLARTSGSADIRDFVQHTIDLQNIRTALRIYEESKEASLPFLLEGGTIPREALAGTIEEIRAAVDRSPIAFTLTSDLLERGEDPSALERALAHVLELDLTKMWNVPLSIEPLFAFAAIAMTQLRVIRAILIGKRNDLSPQEIKRMLPPFLSAVHYLS